MLTEELSMSEESVRNAIRFNDIATLLYNNIGVLKSSLKRLNGETSQNLFLIEPEARRIYHSIQNFPNNNIREHLYRYFTEKIPEKFYTSE